uniref:Uncharacterized protein n=1 Tax=Mucochytrium quahogii TaxID=96639 RepID=A0A7S2RIP8_9STRA|mmetsp:Transcript_44795/g.71570  ORF Transcript_44795/g.71570 Transcript_44795/m.71570 type:complete len:257 (-) Transcript_44795:12-782(-)
MFRLAAVSWCCVAVHALTLREEVNSLVEQSTNNPVCDEILNSDWWAERKAEGNLDSVTVIDTMCATYTGNPTACNDKNSRTSEEFPNASQATLDAACTMVGANSDTCVGNVCNFLNNGNCTLQNTQGTCIWYTSDDLEHVNTAYAAQNRSNITNQGCYRQPCNLPGQGGAGKDICVDQGVPPLFGCTWCSISGQGMGCQMTNISTSAECEYVTSSSGVPTGSLYHLAENDRCECSITYDICNENVKSAPAGVYVQT